VSISGPSQSIRHIFGYEPLKHLMVVRDYAELLGNGEGVTPTP